MANSSFVLRVFSGGHELTPSTSSIDKLSTEGIDSAIETIFHGNYQRVGEPERKLNSGDLSGGEVWVKVVPKSVTPKNSEI